jgi:hypothetical protein
MKIDFDDKTKVEEAFPKELETITVIDINGLIPRFLGN